MSRTSRVCFKKIIPARLRAATRNLYMAHKDLARIAGINPTQLSHYMQGDRLPTIENLAKLSSVLGVSADYLLGSEDTELNKTHQTDQWERHLDKLPKEVRRLLAELVREIGRASGREMKKGTTQQRIDKDKQIFLLWQLLDHIDTLDDACRENDQQFRRLAYETQRRRFQILSGEEYDVLYQHFATEGSSV